MDDAWIEARACWVTEATNGADTVVAPTQAKPLWLRHDNHSRRAATAPLLVTRTLAQATRCSPGPS